MTTKDAIIAGVCLWFWWPLFYSANRLRKSVDDLAGLRHSTATTTISVIFAIVLATGIDVSLWSLIYIWSHP